MKLAQAIKIATKALNANKQQIPAKLFNETGLTTRKSRTLREEYVAYSGPKLYIKSHITDNEPTLKPDCTEINVKPLVL